MPSQHAIPEIFKEDDALGRRLKVKCAEALTNSVRFHSRMDESDWKKFSLLHDLDNLITDHPRFLRSMRFDDPDFEGHVLDVVSHVFDYKPEAFTDLFERSGVQAWFKQNDPDILAIWRGETDPLVTALAHAVAEVKSSHNIIDLTTYLARIEASLPRDPHQTLGSTKDMLEATMRSILRDRGDENFEKLEFPGLVGRCFTMLGLAPNTQPVDQSERYTRKMASSARNMIEAANELRNLAGTGHGRVVGEEVHVSSADASLVASSGLILAAWLLRTHAKA